MQDIRHYLSDEKVSEVMDAFEGLLKPRHSAKLSICLSGAVLTALTVCVCFQSTCLFGILLFFSHFYFCRGCLSYRQCIKADDPPNSYHFLRHNPYFHGRL